MRPWNRNGLMALQVFSRSAALCCVTIHSFVDQFAGRLGENHVLVVKSRLRARVDTGGTLRWRMTVQCCSHHAHIL